jgi:hypothetical protein
VVLTAGAVAGSRDRGGGAISARIVDYTELPQGHTNGGVVRQHCGRVRQARQSCLSPSDAPRASGAALLAAIARIGDSEALFPIVLYPERLYAMACWAGLGGRR